MSESFKESIVMCKDLSQRTTDIQKAEMKSQKLKVEPSEQYKIINIKKMDTLIEILTVCKLTHTRNKTQDSEHP